MKKLLLAVARARRLAGHREFEREELAQNLTLRISWFLVFEMADQAKSRWPQLKFIGRASRVP